MNNIMRKFWNFICRDINFSIIMPTYNRGYIIESSIDSVLNQTFNNYELIIIDDGSTDNTEYIINNKYNLYIMNGKIKYIKSCHAGVSRARNIGLECASNQWIAYIDSDNTINSDFLLYFAKYIKLFNNKCFYCGLKYMKSGKILNKKFQYSKLLKSNFIDLGTFIHSKILINELGCFDENLKRLVDWELILIYTKKYIPKRIKKTLIYYNDDNRVDRITNKEDLQNSRDYIIKKHKI